MSTGEKAASPPADSTAPPAAGAAAVPIFQPFLYAHVMLVAAITGLCLLAWLTVFYGGLKLLWHNSFVESHSWMFPVICLPFSLVVGLLVKYLKAPTSMSESMTDSLAGDTTRIRWRRLPVSVGQSLASLFSGAAIGPEGALGLIASQIAAWYGHAFHLPQDRRPKLVYASVASAYNGLLQNPLFTGVLGIELSETKESGRTSLPANLVGGAIGYGVFRLVGSLVDAPSIAGLLGLPPLESVRIIDAVVIVVMALLGVVVAFVAGIFFKVATKIFGRVRDEVVRALIAGVVFSIAGVAAPILMFSGESEVQDVVKDPAHYGAALLLLMGLAKLALLAVGFRSGFLGGAIFPSIFGLVCVALSIDQILPGAHPTVLVAGLMTGFMVVMFRTPFMVILLVSFMLQASADLLALIVLAVATVLIAGPLLKLVAAKRAGAQGEGGAPAVAPAQGEAAGTSGEATGGATG